MSQKYQAPPHYIEDDIRTVSFACSDLLDWYPKNRRVYPWRDHPTPYNVWISEVMLQQTRIETVLPYYNRFIHEIPNVRALAEVQEERLLKLWEGLGYYSRARNLKRAAVIVVREYDGYIPHEFGNLKKLPGIGDYIAGAISSIAYGMPIPAVDGNAMRVLSRLLACFDDITLPSSRKRMTELLLDVYPDGKSSGDLTQAIMELGETICIPGEKPKCRSCPVLDECEAQKQHIQGKLPFRKSALPRKTEDKTILLLHYENRYALQRRGVKLLYGMWELPSLDGNLDEKQVVDKLAEMGIGVRELAPLGKAKHIFSHVEWNMVGYYVDCANRSECYTWETAENIRTTYAIPSAFRKYKEALLRFAEQIGSVPPKGATAAIG